MRTQLDGNRTAMESTRVIIKHRHWRHDIPKIKLHAGDRFTEGVVLYTPNPHQSHRQ